MRRSGFTLIELLVVIAIIAILAAILFPVFVQARARAKSAMCGSYCKEYALAMTNYLNDYNDMFPAYVNGLIWHEVQSYVKNRKIYYCPEAIKAPRQGYAYYSGDFENWYCNFDYHPYYGSYCYNGWLYCHHSGNNNLHPRLVTLSQIPRSTKNYLFSDGRWIDCWPTNEDDLNGGDINSQVGVWRINVKRHSNGINMAFVDGHVSWLAEGQLVTGASNPNDRRVIYNHVTGD